MENNQVLPAEVRRLEEACAKWTVAFAKKLPEEIRAIAFCAPASFREPEIDDVWQPIALRRGLLRFLAGYPPKLVRSLGGGILRCARGRFGRYDEYLKNGSATLGITPAAICKIEGGDVITAYCHPADAASMSWLVFDPTGRASDGYPVSRFAILRMIFRVLRAWGSVSISRVYDRNLIFAAVISMRWILGMQWINLWMLGLYAQAIARRTLPKQVFCVHEMWPWSRAIWYAIEAEDIPGVTIEHASITRSKLWYFPAAQEVAAGLKLPKKFAVFSQKEKALLGPEYPDTEFSIGCGPRFAHWKERQVTAWDVPQDDAPILLVSSVPWWDNEVVLAAAARLVENISSGRPVIVRLHPFAVVTRKSRAWLKRMNKKGVLTISRAPLQDDIMKAAIVVGMNSTVLEEAAAMGRPIAVLQSDEYLSFGTDLGWHCNVHELDRKILESGIAKHASERGDLMRQGRQALGIDLPVVRLTV